jgi:hypothetical protein
MLGVRQVWHVMNELSYLEYVYVGDDIDRGVGGVTMAII